MTKDQLMQQNNELHEKVQYITGQKEAAEKKHEKDVDLLIEKDKRNRLEIASILKINTKSQDVDRWGIRTEETIAPSWMIIASEIGKLLVDRKIMDLEEKVRTVAGAIQPIIEERLERGEKGRDREICEDCCH